MPNSFLPLDVLIQIARFRPHMKFRAVSRALHHSIMSHPVLLCQLLNPRSTTLPPCKWRLLPPHGPHHDTPRCEPGSPCRDVTHYTFDPPAVDASVTILRNHLWSHAPPLRECERADAELQCLESTLQGAREARRCMIVSLDRRIAELASGAKIARSRVNRMRRRRGRVARIVEGVAEVG